MNQAIGAHSGCEAVVYSRCYAMPPVALPLPHKGLTLTQHNRTALPCYDIKSAALCLAGTASCWAEPPLRC
jgi:hypothetical protein